MEHLVSEEFKARAGLHVSAPFIPDDEFSWLAQMQHYGVPTRLLDFAYSPFVALYFAVRAGAARGCLGSQRDDEAPCVRLWAIDTNAVNARFDSVARRALAKKHGKRIGGRIGFSREQMASDRDLLISETVEMRAAINELLPARGELQYDLNQQGCVCAASPPAFNPRLAIQQGVFLLNFADDLSFNTSLVKMMGSSRTGWCKRFDITADAVPEVELNLFQMNIHEQSLFPDMQGLAGLIRQKLRLHWK